MKEEGVGRRRGSGADERTGGGARERVLGGGESIDMVSILIMCKAGTYRYRNKILCGTLPVH